MDADAGGDAENEAPDDDAEDIDDIQPADADAADDGTDDEEDDEDEDSKLVPTDNLVVVAQVQQNQGISEAQIHVYNEPNKQFYEHRCFYLDSMPLCFEFVGRGGHLLAIGRMEQSIQLWDLDLIEALLPSALASASADKSVGLWDLDAKRCVRMLDKLHSDKVQCLAWHPQEPHLLLTGGYDSTVRLSDCRAPQQQQQQSASSASSAPAAGSAPSWRLDGECERLVWDSRNPFFLMASTERGSVQRCDARAPGA
uniref:WD_REPEATS_REGION domain-containing protein n=1 Tax=Macrostomum lignano TaxID=282301 RepID=A0A1I8GL36_9PLAT